MPRTWEWTGGNGGSGATGSKGPVRLVSARMLLIALVVVAGLVAATLPAGAAQSGPQEGSAPTGSCLNPGNAQTDNDVRATCTETAGVGQTLIGGGFGLDGTVPPGASGIGFVVEIRGLVDNNNGTDQFNVAL